MSYKLDKQLYTGEFADDVALLASTGGAAELAINIYNDVSSPFAARITFEKTKFMVVGHNIQDEDRLPLQIGEACVNYVSILALWWLPTEG